MKIKKYASGLLVVLIALILCLSISANAFAAIPGALTFTDITANSVTLNWDALPETPRYYIYRVTPNNNISTLIGSTTETSFTVTDLSTNGYYGFYLSNGWDIYGIYWATTNNGRIIDLADTNMPATNRVEGTNWWYQGNVYHITGDGVVVTGSTPETTTIDKRVVIETDCTVTLESIRISTSNGSPIKLNPGTNVTLKLTESKNYLSANNATGAGIETTGATLTIEGRGMLTVTGKYGAGIGGGCSTGSDGSEGGIMIDGKPGGDGSGGNGGIVTINGVTVTATSTYGAGIGGGYGGDGGRGGASLGGKGGKGGNGGKGGDGSIVTINGANVTATSKYSTGIGGGCGGNGSKGGPSYLAVPGTVIIIPIIKYYGKGGDGGNGGNGGNGGDIEINGGTVTAIGDKAFGGSKGGEGGGKGGGYESNGNDGHDGWTSYAVGSLTLPAEYNWLVKYWYAMLFGDIGLVQPREKRGSYPETPYEYDRSHFEVRISTESAFE